VFEVCCASFFASRALYILYRFIGDSVNKDEKDWTDYVMTSH